MPSIATALAPTPTSLLIPSTPPRCSSISQTLRPATTTTTPCLLQNYQAHLVLHLLPHLDSCRKHFLHYHLVLSLARTPSASLIEQSPSAHPTSLLDIVLLRSRYIQPRPSPWLATDVTSSCPTSADPTQPLPAPISLPAHRAVRSMPSSIVATRGEQLGRLKLQFNGQDGTGCERPHYIPRHCLEEFWEAHSISAILRACSINKSQNVIFQSFLCTFSLLVYINKVDFLGWLVERNLKDATFPLESRPSFWPDTPSYDKLFEAITEWQWIFFPVTLEQHELYNQVFSPQYIFPICTEELIKAGDTIQVHKIETNPSCAGSDPVRSNLAGGISLVHCLPMP